MNAGVSGEERGWAMAAIRVSDGAPYRHPFCPRLVK
jgi:hypothetical protein